MPYFFPEKPSSSKVASSADPQESHRQSRPTSLDESLDVLHQEAMWYAEYDHAVSKALRAAIAETERDIQRAHSSLTGAERELRDGKRMLKAREGGEEGGQIEDFKERLQAKMKQVKELEELISGLEKRLMREVELSSRKEQKVIDLS